MSLDELLDLERSVCADTCSEAWKLRCEVIHYAKLPRDERLARLNEMRGKKRIEHADYLATEVNVLLQQLGIKDRDAAPVQRTYPGKSQFSNSKFNKLGQPWTSNDDKVLRAEFENGMPTHKLASLLGRTERAIAMRLEKLKLAA
jgi:hypothetical protein